MTPVTRETLDALPVGTVVLDREGDAWIASGEGLWQLKVLRPEEATVGSEQVAQYGPVIVLLTPEQANAQTAEAVREARIEAWNDGYRDALWNESDGDPSPGGPWRENPYRADREEGRS